MKIKKRITLNDIYEKAKEFSFRSDFKNNFRSHYNKAIKLGILNKVCEHMPKSKQDFGIELNKKWTDESLKKEALKYKTRLDFCKGGSGAYQTALRSGKLDEFCKHMNKIRENWTLDKIKLEALKYNTKTDFQKNNLAAYLAASRRGLIDEVCSHMPNMGGKSVPELEILEMVKKTNPSAKSKRFKISLSNKPYIKSFEIDIFIPEHNKGIEFDGEYWHSIEGLKKSRKSWPENDLQNYHQIKDDAFKQIGIEILHIKEIDWIENKIKCIEEINNFITNL